MKEMVELRRMKQRVRTLSLFFAVALVAACGIGSAANAASDTMVEGAKQCTRYLPRYERQYGIPVHLLAAISSTESGRWHDGLHISLPWPWTINADGKGYYYNSKQEAVSAARRLMSNGAHSVDVGCMQVNLQHHPKAFSSLDEAFEPEYNVAYAATFLHSLYEESHSWHAAAAAYHSRTPSAGMQYVSQVYDRWNTILDRIRASRLNAARAAGGVAAGGGLTPAENSAAREVAVKAPPESVHVVHDRPTSRSQAVEARRNTGPVLIRPQDTLLSAQPKPQASIQAVPPQVVRPGTTPQVVVQSNDVTLADARTAGTLSPSAGQPATQPHIVNIHPEMPVPHREGPRFIFND